MLAYTGAPWRRNVLGGLLAALLLATPAMGQTPAPEVLHYWAFNGGGTAPEAWPPPIPADIGTGTMDHTLTVEGPGGHATFAGSSLNLQAGYTAGGSFVPQGNHNNGNAFILHIPTTGYENIAISYATQRTNSGFTSQTFAYSVDGGGTYTDVVTVTDLPTSYVLRTVDLSGIPEVNGAADLRVRVTLDGATNAQANSRFDNMTVRGTPRPAVPSYLQFIHASPDPAAATVDVYLGAYSEDAGALVTGAPAFEGVAFRAASPYTELPAATYRIVITVAGSAAPLLEEIVSLGEGQTVQLAVAGMVETAGSGAYPEGGASGLSLLVNAASKWRAQDEAAVAVNLLHVVPDAALVVARLGSGASADSVRYGEAGGYVVAEAGPVLLTIGGGGEARFTADLTGLAGEAVTVVATGFSEPPGEGMPPFGLVLVMPDGTTVPLAQEVSLAEARALPAGSLVTAEGVVSRARGAKVFVQDEAAAVGVILSTSELRAVLESRAVTEGTRLRFAGRTSRTPEGVLVQPDGPENVVVMGYGEGPAPEEATLAAIAAGGERFDGRLVRVSRLTTVASGAFAADTSYPVTDGTLEGGLSLRIPDAPDTELVGAAIPTAEFTFTGVVAASGADGLSAGGYQLLGILESDVHTEEVPGRALVQLVHNAPDPALAAFDVYVDGERILESFPFRTATPYFDVPLNVTLGLTPAGSASDADAVFTGTYALTPGTRYQLIAVGLDASETEDTAPAILVHADARAAAAGGVGEVELAFVHGTPDAPVLDLMVMGDRVPSALGYRGVTPYRTVAAASASFSLSTVTDDGPWAASFTVDMSGAGGAAMTALTSGFLSPERWGEGVPALALLIVSEDGQTQLIERDAEQAPVSNESGVGALGFRVEGNYPNPFATITTLRYDLPTSAEVRVEVYDVLGRRLIVSDTVQAAGGVGLALPLDASGLSAGTYVWRLTARMATGTLAQTGRMTIAR